MLILSALSRVFGVAVVFGFSHPFHVSVAELEYNPETKCIEVALRVWPEDLEKALNRDTKKKVSLDDLPQVDKLILAYLNKNIFISADGKKRCELKWVGKELEIKQAWLYFEVKTGAPPERFTFSNTVFFELQNDQINIFNLKFRNRRASLSFTNEKSRLRLSEKDFAPIRNPFVERDRKPDKK